MLLIKEAANLAGVTVRTLHYYDEIGLLRPSKVSEAGYRLYDEEDMKRLQQILFFRELNFPLEKIQEIMNQPGYDCREAFIRQKELLSLKRDRLDRLLGLLDQCIKGEQTMEFEAFDRSKIKEQEKKYAKEVVNRWGDSDAYKESKKKTGAYGKEEWQQVTKEAEDIFRAFASKMDQPVESTEVQELVKRWQDHITARYYYCTDEILSGLGQMYTADERFQRNIDQYGEGLAEFLSKAIEVYCGQKNL